MWTTKQELLELSLELVKQESISRTNGEVEIAKLVYNKLANIDYFKNNPNHLELVPLNDELGRYSVCALMRSKNKSKKTLITVAHMDTVGVDDAGSLKEYIYDAYQYTEKLKENLNILDESSKYDLLSGDYLFARGIMDMKAGLALHMSLLEYFSLKEKFDGNIMLLAVPDEEVNSDGAISVIPFVNKILEKEGLEAVAVLNCEPDFALYDGDESNYIYLGSCGKLLPGFFVVGKEVHVGESLSGMNTNLLSSELISRLELNTDLCESVDGEVSVPPTCLKYKDNKEEYNVQTPLTSVIYYNIQTLNTTPKEVLNKLKIICNEASNAAYEKVNSSRTKYEKLTKGKYEAKRSNLDVKVLTFNELYNQVVKDNGDEFKAYLERKISKWVNDKALDDRDLSTNIVKEVHRFSKDRNPMIIIFFSPPYYPNVGIDESKELDEKLVFAVDKVLNKAKESYNLDIKKQNYFQGLSDLSYFSLQNADEVIESLKPNMPAIGYKYKLPLEEIKKLNIPAVNLGPHGKDAHKFTERILVDYSYGILPKLLRELVVSILEN